LFVTTGAFIQTGTMTVYGQPSVVRINSSGTIDFAPRPGGLVGLDTWLILDLTGGGTGTGGLEVKSLDVMFTVPTGGTTLTGTVNGLNGNAAAAAAGIQPRSDAVFQINGCPIASINCVLLTTTGVPAAPPLRDIVVGNIIDPSDVDDLLLPLVSDQEY
jgi:hypothetical protein